MHKIYTLVGYTKSKNTIKLKSGEYVEKREYSDDDVKEFIQQAFLWEIVKHVEEDHDHDDYGETSSSENMVDSIEPEIMLVNNYEVIGCVVDDKALLFSNAGKKVAFAPYSYNVSRIHSVYATGYYMLRQVEGYGTDWLWDDEIATITVLRKFNAASQYVSKHAVNLIVEKDVEIKDVGAIKTLKKLETIEFRNSFSIIPERTFDACSTIKRISLPETVTQIGDHAFSCCDNLEEISLPNVIEIGRSAFFRCSSLEEISLPNVVEIKSFAFEYCSKLKTVAGCKKLKKIWDSAFKDCVELQHFFVGPQLEMVSGFEGCLSLESFSMHKDNEYYSCENGILYNKDKSQLIFYPKSSKVIDYELPKSICELSKSAFARCKTLKSVVLHDGISNIPDNCFVHCESLESVIMPNSIIELGKYAFWGCDKLKNINLPSNIEYITDGLFGHCYSLVSVELPDTLQEIGKESFKCCNSLKKMDIPMSVNSIKEEAFHSCGNLSCAIIRNPDCTIGYRCFYNCGASLIIKYPVGATFLDALAFGKNTKFDLIEGKRVEFKFGGVYEGYFDDSLTGYGIYRFKKGGIYEGEFVNGKFEGQGVRKYTTGSKYEGGFKNDKFYGEGMVTYSNGDTLIGEFNEGKPWNAVGVDRYVNGTNLTGKWVRGLFTGYGKVCYKDGTWWKGTWINGEKDKKECSYPKDLE